MATIAIDVKNTYQSMFFTGSGPKNEYNSNQNAPAKQEVNGNGELVWTALIAVTYHAQPGRKLESEVIEVSVPGTDPSQTVAPGLVDVEGLTAWLSAPKMGERGIQGGRPRYSARKLVPSTAAQANGSKSYAAAKSDG